MSKVDLSTYTLGDLQELSRDIDKEVKRREIEEKRKVLAQVKELAASVGMTVEEILEAGGTQKKTKGQPKYCNPDDPEQTWTGRGKRPAWFNQAINSGKTLEDLMIP
jgi:DNA-binding protein H-NS